MFGKRSSSSELQHVTVKSFEIEKHKSQVRTSNVHSRRASNQVEERRQS